ncbi:hypothetical protein L596_018545 [Steinernema carpocapsae]|uniref:Uncharacterized protein n=1 Tax=Steinernema carpocapsae TaxID=34508 RepID=A0A4U5N5D2_STECR|nr:hypothetical protein L596_018545 [Steinernema carpocapsae]
MRNCVVDSGVLHSPIDHPSMPSASFCVVPSGYGIYRLHRRRVVGDLRCVLCRRELPGDRNALFGCGGVRSTRFDRKKCFSVFVASS